MAEQGSRKAWVVSSNLTVGSRKAGKRVEVEDNDDIDIEVLLDARFNGTDVRAFIASSLLHIEVGDQKISIPVFAGIGIVDSLRRERWRMYQHLAFSELQEILSSGEISKVDALFFCKRWINSHMNKEMSDGE